MIVFDYERGDDDDRVRFAAAEKALADGRSDVAITTLDDLVGLGTPGRWTALPSHKDGGDRLAAIIHSSGSTGVPKGAMLPERAVAAAWHVNLPDGPVISMGLAPQNHLMGRLNLYGALGIGGLVHFTLAPDMSTLIEDIRLARPTVIAFFPRILDTIYQDYLNQVSRRVSESGVSQEQAREDVMNEMRGVYLGDRLLRGTVGSAPTTDDIRRFVKSTFSISFSDGYGNTEAGNGMITFNNRIVRPDIIDYRLRDVPELGYYTTDKPYPRGELCFKSKTQILGYFKNPEATAKLLDEDGFSRTGDIVEEREPDYVAVIDRRNDVLKLSQGEYVAVGRLGVIFETESDVIQQIYVYGNSLKSYLVAVVVPDQEALAQALGGNPEPGRVQALIREELQKAAAKAELKSFEVPREFIVEYEPFTQENGLLTSVRKKMRPALKAKYGERLEALYEEGERLKTARLDAVKDPESGLSTVEKLRILLASNLGIEESDINDKLSYAEQGGDSLGSVSFALSLENAFGVEVHSNDILSPAGNIDVWGKLIDGGAGDGLAGFEDVHGEGQSEIFARDLSLEKFLPAEELEAAAASPRTPVGQPKTVFLTGANGFLGRFVCLEWLKRVAHADGKLICLVRGPDDDAARRRLDDVFEAASPEMKAAFEGLSAHLEVVAGDFGQPRFGLSVERFNELASRVDLVSHVGALVNHVMTYRSLFTPNVAGTAEVIRFALQGRKKPVDFVSSTAVTPHLQFNTGGHETAELAESVELSERYARGYGASKWAGEILLQKAHERFGLAIRIFRGDMMLAHRQFSGQINVDDMFTRLLYSIIKTGLAPQSFYEPNPDGSRALVHYDGTPVDIVAASVVDGGRFFAEGKTVFSIDNPFTDFRNSLDAFVDWIIDSGYSVHRLAAHDEWVVRFKQKLASLPEQEKKQSALAILKAFERPFSFVPFRAESKNFQALIGQMGISSSDLQLDAAFIYKCLQDIAARGLIAAPEKRPAPLLKAVPDTKTIQAYGVAWSDSPVTAMDIGRRLPGPRDVAIDIEYCGICHSDIHFAHNDWGNSQYPLVPGHEIIGRVAAVGKDVTEFVVGGRVAVGCMVDSCRTCSSCEDGLEQYCEHGLVWTYNGYDHRHQNALTFGGYSRHIVVDEAFVMPVPEKLDGAGAAPLLCAGITAWSPLREWDVKEGMKVGIVGLGGLGHMAVKFASALGAHTVMITTSPGKAKDAKALGAHEVLISKDPDAMRNARGSFDFILDTVPVKHPVDNYLRLLRRDATLCLVGAIEPLDFHGGQVMMRRRKISGSSIGSIRETRQMLDFCGARNITADVEVVSPTDINSAWGRVLRNDVKYRFVIDLRK